MSKTAGRDRISVADALTPLPSDTTRNGNGRTRKPAIVEAAAFDDPHSGEL
jgi:hypothetical protein